MAVRKSPKPKNFKKAITAKLQKPISPQKISRERNKQTEFTQKLQRSVVQYPTAPQRPQKKTGKAKTLTSKEKVMMPEKVTVKNIQKDKKGNYRAVMGVAYHSRPNSSGTNSTTRKSGAYVPKVKIKGSPTVRKQQNAMLKKELYNKVAKTTQVITGGQATPRYHNKKSVSGQSGLVQKKQGKQRRK